MGQQLTDLFLKLSLVDADFGVNLVEGFLKKSNILLVLLALDHDLLDLAFLLAHDLDGLSMTSLLLIELEFHIAKTGFQLADDAFASDDGVSLNLFQTDGQILDLDFQGLLDSLDLNNAFLFFVEGFHGVLQVGLNALVAFVGYAEFLCDLVVVASQNGEFLFDLDLGGGNVDVDGSQLVDAADRFLILNFGGSLSTKGLQRNHVITQYSTSSTHRNLQIRSCPVLPRIPQ